MRLAFRTVLGAIIELFFPLNAVCMGCSSPLGADEDWLCLDCKHLLAPARYFGGARCPVCSRFSRRGLRCKSCKDWPEDGVSHAYFAYRYAPPADLLVRRMKYDGVYLMADWMASEMYEAYMASPLAEPDALIAVPMHKNRMRTRGFNQAQLLAERLGALSGVEVMEALFRTRNTKQQARLNAAQRHVNLNGAFSADASVAGLRVLLIDDVLTTGSTASHCAQALRCAGAKDVQLLTFAAAD